MYLPAHFGSDDGELLRELVDRHDFAQLCAVDADGGLEIAHLPFFIRDTPDGPVLRCHVARGNPIWKLADGQRVFTAVFAGPHAYVSPTWYQEPGKQVPTWNYAVVHAVGPAIAIDDPAWLRQLLVDLSARHEAPEAPWTIDRLEPAHLDRLLRGIVGLELRAPTFTGKLKLSQNRDADDQRGVLAGLDQRGEHDLVALMRRVLRAP
jgi:transcriptional regulator